VGLAAGASVVVVSMVSAMVSHLETSDAECGIESNPKSEIQNP
jgi:hypothetical protein